MVERAQTVDPLVAQAQMFLAHAQALAEIKQKVDQQETKVNTLEVRVKDVLAQEGHMTVLGYSLTHGLELSSKTLGGIGRRMAAYCKEHGHVVGKIRHQKYGAVNTYPEALLNHLFFDYWREVEG